MNEKLFDWIGFWGAMISSHLTENVFFMVAFIVIGATYGVKALFFDD